VPSARAWRRGGGSAAALPNLDRLAERASGRGERGGRTTGPPQRRSPDPSGTAEAGGRAKLRLFTRVRRSRSSRRPTDRTEAADNATSQAVAIAAHPRSRSYTLDVDGRSYECFCSFAMGSPEREDAERPEPARETRSNGIDRRRSVDPISPVRHITGNRAGGMSATGTTPARGSAANHRSLVAARRARKRRAEHRVAPVERKARPRR